MNQFERTVRERIALLRWALPLSFVVLVFLYQLGPARWAHDIFNQTVHYAIEIIFYATVGPLLTFWTLKRIERWLDEKEQAEAAARASERRLAAITSASADAIFGVDSKGCIDSWNRGAEFLFDYTAREVEGQPFTALLQGEDSRDVQWRWLQQAVAQEGFVRSYEAACVDARGRAFTVELTATRLEGSDGQAPGMSIIMRDITHRKQREEEIRRLNTSLNEQVQERTHELAEKVEELAQANSELQKVDQTRTEFVSLVSHQVRAPLTNMRGAVERMRADCVTANTTCSRMFNVLEQQVLHLDGLVQDVLTSERIDAGRFALHREPVSMMPLLKRLVEQAQARRIDRPIVLANKPGLPLVLADPDRVTDVVANLLDNADKYSPPGQPILIDVRADAVSLTVSVRDFGPGLSPADLERVFDKFYRPDSSDAQLAYGYGLGLYVCRRLIEVQQGHIWAENHAEGGAVFSFSLPVCELQR